MTDAAYIRDLRSEAATNASRAEQLRGYVAVLAPLDASEDGPRTAVYVVAIMRLLARNSHIDQLIGAIHATHAMREDYSA